MDRLTSLSFLSLITLAGSASLGCSDDQSTGVMDPGAGAGTGGAAGAASTAGAGGTSAGTGGMAGSEAAGGTGGETDPLPPPFTGIATCSQCVEVAVPVSGGNSDANVLDQVGFPFFFAAPGQDFGNVTVTWHVMALENNPDLMVAPYSENGAPYAGAYGAHVALSEENFPPGQWVDVVFDLSRVALPPATPDGGVDAGGDAGAGEDADAGAAVLLADAGLSRDAGGDASVSADTDAGPVGDGNPAASAFRLIDPGFDKRLIEQLGIYVGSATTLQGDAVARVAIDAVTFTGTPQRADILFDAGLQGFTKNTYNEPPGTEGPLLHP